MDNTPDGGEALQEEPKYREQSRPAETHAILYSHLKEIRMSVRTIGRQFVEMCNQGKNFDVMESMYAPDIVSVEGDGKETAGKRPVIDKSKRWVEVNTFHGEKVRGPYFCGGTDSEGQFAVHFTLEVTRKATGQRLSLEEVALYTVKNDKITREQFFYEGEH